MNGLLALAAGFLDRMTNPQYGAEVNEEFSLRFNQLLVEDPEFAASFASLALGPEDIDSLPICAWPWYLQWRSEHADPPSAEFLDALYEATDDPAVQMAVMQSDLSERAPGPPQQASTDRPSEDRDLAVTDEQSRSLERLRDLGDRPEPEGRLPIQSRWLGTRLGQLRTDSESIRSLPGAIAMATYLLQLGDPASLESLRVLLDHQWAGQRELADAIRRQLREANLDPQTLADWDSVLGLGETGEQG